MNTLQLEDSNLGKPTNPKIKLNPKKASKTIPQAWKKEENWYYNFEGALAEAEFLGKKIPTKEQWDEICKQFCEDGDRLSKELNLPIAGYRNRSNGFYYYQDTHGFYWSSSPKTTNTFNLTFSSVNVRPTYTNYCAYGFTVRCLKN